MNDKLKVCMLTPYFYPHTGGTEKYVKDLSIELVKKGHEVTVISNNVPTSAHAPAEEVMDGVKVKRLPATDLFYAPTTLSFSLDMVKGFDLVHTHAPAFGFTRSVAGKLGIPVVTTFHCDTTLSNRAFGMAMPDFVIKAVEFVGNTMGNYVLPKVDEIIVTTESYASTSPVAKNFPHTAIPIGIHSGAMDKKINEKGISEATRDRNRILFLGRLAANKGVDILLKAMPKILAKFPDAHLVICGKGEEEASLRKLVSDLGLDKKVNFYGVLNFDQLVDFYANSALFAMPSTNRLEAFGIVQLEAMACRTPVVCSDLPGVNSVAKDGGLIAKIGDVDDLAEKIMRVLGDPALAQKMGEAGRRLVDTVYRWDTIVEEVLKVYRRAIDKKKSK